MNSITNVSPETIFQDKTNVVSYLTARFKCPFRNLSSFTNSSSSSVKNCQLESYSFLLYWFASSQNSQIYISNQTFYDNIKDEFYSYLPFEMWSKYINNKVKFDLVIGCFYCKYHNNLCKIDLL